MRQGLIIGGAISVLLGCALTLAPTEAETIPVLEIQELNEMPKDVATDVPDSQAILVEIGTVYKAREFSYEEAQLLMKIAQAEGGNQGVEGMKLIMAVVLNRVEDPEWPNTIHDVIYQPENFYVEGMSNEPSAEAHEALAYVESGQPLDEDIIAFETTDSEVLERYFEYKYTVGDHKFFRKKGGN